MPARRKASKAPRKAPARKAVLRPAPRPLRAAVLLFLVTFLCYLANGRTTPYIQAGDTIPNRLIPFSILRFGTLTLDPFREDMEAAGGFRWYVQERDGHLVSFYPIGTPLIALPVYVPLYLGLAATGPVSSARLFAAAPVAEKLTASFLAALSCALFYLLVRRRVPPRVAVWAALAFGLASSMWATASQLLWQHGPVVLMLTAALWLLTWPERPAWSLAGAGCALSLAVMARPSALFFALAGCATAFAGDGPLTARLRRVLLLTAAALPAAALTLLYNWTFFRSLSGAYGQVSGELVPARIGEGAAGLLFSPNRGLLVFTPIALFGLVGLGRAFIGMIRPTGEGRDPLLAFFGLASLAHVALMGSYREWAGGWSFGPRYLVDVLPVLALAGAGMWPRLRPAWKPLAGAALVWSLLVQVNGAFAYPASRWNVRMSEAGLEQAAWDWRHFSLWEDQVAWWELGKSAPRF